MIEIVPTHVPTSDSLQIYITSKRLSILRSIANHRKEAAKKIGVETCTKKFSLKEAHPKNILTQAVALSAVLVEIIVFIEW